jgi:hypothetical protein
MSENLSGEELVALVQRVFRPRPADRALAVLVDLPDDPQQDTPAWRQRRHMAAEWVQRLAARRAVLQLEVQLCLYPSVGMNNADLPERAWRGDPSRLPATAAELDPASSSPFAAIFDACSLLLAPTEFSATAPLKLAAPRHAFRAATMPGFSPEMIPALRLDYGEINRRVCRLKELLDRAQRAELRFAVGGAAHELVLDLRHRTAHASGGLLTEPGTAGNLPSGEAYIVPYEGEVPGVPSGSAGRLPVQFGADVVVFEIEANQAVRVTGEGKAAAEQAAWLAAEPAYGNLAELGLGVLADLGVQPTGEILLDEKLGLHIAFGRSDHFGGQVGAAQFSKPEAVVHIDRIYLPSLQPRVNAKRVELTGAEGKTTVIMRDGVYVGVF